MKKNLKLIAGIISTFLFVTVTNANQQESAQTMNVNYPIYMDGFLLPSDIPKVMINDRIYLPIRTICEMFKADIEWRNNTVYIDTYYGTTNMYFEITPEKALKIEEAIFKDKYEQLYGESVATILRETEDTYVIHRTMKREYPIAGGDLTVTISKKDGRIISAIGGE